MTEYILGKFKRSLNILLLLLFFTHGLLYYFNPNDLLNPASPLKWIKYIICLFFLILNINRINLGKVLIVLSCTIFFFLSFLLANGYFEDFQGFNASVSNFIRYLFPFLTILFISTIKKISPNLLIRFIWILTITSGYIEFFILQGIFREFDLGVALRVSTIFINPNNAALLIGLLNYYVVSSLNTNKVSSYFLAIFFFGNSLGVILLTGSKTGIVIIMFHVLLLLLQLFKKLTSKKISVSFVRFIFIGWFLFTFFGGFYLVSGNDSFFDANTKNKNQTRELKLDTGSERVEQFTDFGNDLKSNFLYPFLNKKDFTIDNAYLQFWGDFGFFGFLLLFLTITWVCFNYLFYSTQKSFPFLILFASGFSMNILYLWPTAYLFWWYVFEGMKIKQLRKNVI